MKTLGLIGLMGLMLCGCDDAEKEQLRHQVKRDALDLSKAKARIERLEADLQRMNLEVVKANGRAMVSDAEADVAKSRVENARKLGKAEALIERMEGK